MDIYFLPTGQLHATKVMMLIHGGGWTGGDKMIHCFCHL